jgi:uncharacterized protein
MENEKSQPQPMTILAWLPAQALILAVRAYQLLISPWLGSVCRYHPSCSHYMIAAVRKHGFWRGGWRGVLRIARCHPWHPGGYDPP